MKAFRACFATVVITILCGIASPSARAGQFDSEAADLQAAWNLMAQCRPIYDGHRYHAMMRTTEAGKIIGINLGGFRSGTLTKEQAQPKLIQARALVQRAQTSLAAKKKPVAADKCARAARQLDEAMASK